MIQPSAIQSQKTPDVLVIGAGVFGLWAARHAILAGKRVCVLEKRTVGAGASGGFLGALMPHMPDRWNARKQFQFDALASLPEAVARLEADTGLVCGSRRCGRLVPIGHEKTLDVVARRIRGAVTHWQGRFAMTRLDRSDEAWPAGWPDAPQAPFGLQFDDLSARIDPRAYLAALRAFVTTGGALHEGVEVVRLEPGRAVLADGAVIAAGKIVVAAGWEAYPLLQPFMGGMAANPGGPVGRGVKGQAMLLELAHGDELPIVYGEGVYVVPHDGNRVAIGSTARDDWDEPASFEPTDTAFHAR
ncbi:MAG: FAD-dependent oxidoreductase, partial [Pseudomonadota bacterium]|nr:FAD-dependent oxidoreductase [Pseudomonadota bacterium]